MNPLCFAAFSQGQGLFIKQETNIFMSQHMAFGVPRLFIVYENKIFMSQYLVFAKGTRGKSSLPMTLGRGRQR